MQRSRAEEILGEWGVRDVTPSSVEERKQLERDRDLNPLAGSRLPRRIRRFRPEADAYVASLGGPLPYMQRLREIDEETERHAARLTEAWAFEDVNELIEKHNRWYPIEARLAMDPRSRDFVKVGGRDYRREPLDASWVLELFPV
jgi:hypothetical protein